MNAHPYRLGNATSSEIVALMANDRSGKAPGVKFYTYVDQCNWERRLGRPIDNEVNAKPCAWGNLCEEYVQSKPEYISTQYTQRPDEPIIHPDFNYWSGTPDMTKADTVADIKSPFTLTSFCQLVQPIYDGLTGLEAINKVRDTHKDGDKFYWQLVSNAILTNSNYAELHVFCPYKSELNEIRALAQQQDGAAGKYYGIAMSNDEDLPYLIEGGYYKNINVIRFEVPQSDKDALIKRIELAGKLLETVKTEVVV